jgi:2-dehydro-3-deoxyphosphogalactonate aldolase
MRNSKFWWILIGFMILLDIYVFQAVKVVSQPAGSKMKILIYVVYWLISASAIITLLILPYLHFEKQSKLFRTTIFAVGFTAVKFDPAAPYSAFDPRQPSLVSLELCEKFCRLIRESVGSKADLLFGTHGQFTASGAIRLAKRLERYDPLWFEEPTPPEMPEEMAKVARATSIPVATGERLVTKYEFARVLETGAASILQMALGRVGGIMEAKKIAAMAETHYAQIAPHLYAGPVEGAANVHFAASLPNFLILESIGRWDGFHAKILKKPIRWEEGRVILPTEPGLGIELDEDVARAHPYAGTKLHLEMTERPIA